MSESRAVVTGAAGFIGCSLVEQIVKTGSTVVGIDNERSGDWRRVTVPCERVDRDLTDLTADELTDLVAGADVVFHLAAEKYNSSKSSPQRVIDVNIVATQRLFEACTRARVAKVVFTSSLYAYGSLGPAPMNEDDIPAPTTTYGMSKVAGEHLLRIAERDHGLRWSVARLFFVYGPRQHAEGGYKSVITSNFERLLRGERPTVFGDGKQALDYVYIDDAVSALLELARPDHDCCLYNIGTGRGISVNELTELMLQIAGSDLEPRPCPPDWTDGSTRVGDIQRAIADLAWAPTTSMDEGLRRVWDAMVNADG